jgi:hypothetical protein
MLIFVLAQNGFFDNQGYCFRCVKTWIPVEHVFSRHSTKEVPGKPKIFFFCDLEYASEVNAFIKVSQSIH